MEILAVNVSSLAPLRRDYFNSLPEFQELYLELMIEGANCHLLIEGKEKMGYAITTEENTLIEFFLRAKHIPQCATHFAQTIKDLQIRTIFCKSFDALLLNCCLLHQYEYTLEGCLYRDYNDDGQSIPSTIGLKRAKEADLGTIRQHQDCFDMLFETEEYLRTFVENDYVYLCYQGEELVGCGTLIRTHPEWDFCDLGVWVKADFRKQGIGTQIISSLRTKALHMRLQPSCGCAMDNIASQKTIEKAGFISSYKLIEFRKKEG